MKTKKPSAIIYGWNKQGNHLIESDVYFQENLHDLVQVYSLPYTNNVTLDYTTYKPDLIISINQSIEIPHTQLQKICIQLDHLPTDCILANIVVCESVFRNCELIRPRFSIFTPTYNTGERILRTYEGLKNQLYTDWEWIVLDDSPDQSTFNIVKDIAKNDYRVKLHKVYPLSEGNIGLVKHRAATLCNGDWLVELDHDDYLTSECLSIANDAINTYPDAGFLYTNCSEMYDDGEPKYYDHNWEDNWYARPDNLFDFGYAGHTWVTVDQQRVLAHHYPDINPLTIRFNISMPNHVRMWERNLYHKIGGHNKKIPVADDLELLIRTFLNTKMIHVKRVLYFQYNNRNSTVDNNVQDINRRARLIRDYYDSAIHDRIIELGCYDWNWNEEQHASQKFINAVSIKKYYEDEQVMNYIYK